MIFQTFFFIFFSFFSYKNPDNFSPGTHSEPVFVIDNNGSAHPVSSEMAPEVALQPFLISTADGTFHSLYHGSHSAGHGLGPSGAHATSLGSPYQLGPQVEPGGQTLFQLEQHHIEPTIIYHTIAQVSNFSSPIFYYIFVSRTFFFSLFINFLFSLFSVLFYLSYWFFSLSFSMAQVLEYSSSELKWPM